MTQTKSKPKYEIEVQLAGTDGNALALIGKVTAALRKGGVSAADVGEFSDECLNCGSYDELLQLLMATVHVS